MINSKTIAVVAMLAMAQVALSLSVPTEEVELNNVTNYEINQLIVQDIESTNERSLQNGKDCDEVKQNENNIRREKERNRGSGGKMNKKNSIRYGKNKESNSGLNGKDCDEVKRNENNIRGEKKRNRGRGGKRNKKKNSRYGKSKGRRGVSKGKDCDEGKSNENNRREGIDENNNREVNNSNPTPPAPADSQITNNVPCPTLPVEQEKQGGEDKPVGPTPPVAQEKQGGEDKPVDMGNGAYPTQSSEPVPAPEPANPDQNPNVAEQSLDSSASTAFNGANYVLSVMIGGVILVI